MRKSFSLTFFFFSLVLFGLINALKVASKGMPAYITGEVLHIYAQELTGKDEIPHHFAQGLILLYFLFSYLI